ncbi:hypothetical protein BJP41_09410 [Candidatus Williamhamiltonella defendens]|uniref:NAD(+)--protein-arginine ADP-ribosyltransferase n=1 Tax=Candidatus Williamhamiltonella defendens TaxID=138072 RepID=A0A2D3T461_9ENTR|nr:ADP-ribosyltransferase [Candidatus Hamiltonella defensa]ATW30504.1 hypothetical protein BJP41_09410 [Candidatus Hamiltonella defensa]ATW32513.1 hypothetical protein BJP42_09720 [Candidatus Hamiltonella defensa]
MKQIPSVHQGLSSAFEVKSDNQKLEKTYRGVNGPDSFDKISEGESTSDTGYLSTSRKFEVAQRFSKSLSAETRGSISVIFGKSGMDISDASMFNNSESEVLYRNNTEMTLLFSGINKKDVKFRVLQEKNLPDETGTEKRLVDALDLNISNLMINTNRSLLKILFKRLF